MADQIFQRNTGRPRPGQYKETTDEARLVLVVQEAKSSRQGLLKRS